MNTYEELKASLDALINGRKLKKLILSVPEKKEILRAEGRLVSEKGDAVLQLATYTADNHVAHRNIPESDAGGEIAALMREEYRRLNVICAGGELSAMRSAKGKLTVIDRVPKESASLSELLPLSHNREKKYILPEGEPCDFLIALGVSDKDGRVYDKKQAKFRQINRFLEFVGDIYGKLPAEGTLRVLDLCCGKSYLTFAVYYYLTKVKGRTVEMLGADLKKDVIEFCEKTARDLRYDGLSFVCRDIGDLETPAAPDLVLSLHACDIATDIVLAKALASEAKVILSTPCCHHEAAKQLSCSDPALMPILEQPILRARFCDQITDALRCRYLTANGYRVTTAELIDPDDTPKNLLIRAVRGSGRVSPEALAEYRSACEKYGLTPSLPLFHERYLNNIPKKESENV
ncbi:MAG: SAM-dependent methyltransferase [Lachnospiraceae bacterium]|nr:SAM-dependent methyltransferase [Lachnospiraceae bacterium]